MGKRGEKREETFRKTLGSSVFSEFCSARMYVICEGVALLHMWKNHIFHVLSV